MTGHPRCLIRYSTVRHIYFSFLPCDANMTLIKLQIWRSKTDNSNTAKIVDIPARITSLVREGEIMEEMKKKRIKASHFAF